MRKFTLLLSLLLSLFILGTAVASTTVRVMHLKLYNNTSQSLTFRQANLIPGNQLYLAGRLLKNASLNPGRRLNLRWVANGRRNNVEGTLLFTGARGQQVSIYIRNPLQFSAQEPIVSVKTKPNLRRNITYIRNSTAPLKMIWKRISITLISLSGSNLQRKQVKFLKTTSTRQ